MPELPAESCNEIKASEGQSASSGKYWMQVESASFNKVALTYCGMETGGEYSKQKPRHKICETKCNVIGIINSVLKAWVC